MRRSVRFLLERRHAELVVEEAVDGVDEIEKAKQIKPDLILAMPLLNWSGSRDSIETYAAGNPDHFVFNVYRSACRFSNWVSWCRFYFEG